MTADADALAARGAAFHEGAELLRWLEDGMLTQLGHVLRRRDGSQVEAAGHLPHQRRACCSRTRATSAPSPGSKMHTRARAAAGRR